MPENSSPTVLACSTWRDPEREPLTISIRRRAGDARRVVMALPPGGRTISSMPALKPGDRIEVSAELEVTTDADEEGHAWVGKDYGFDPKISAHLILADNDDATEADPEHAVAFGPTPRVVCDRRQHHHIVVFDQVPYTVGPEGLPWKGHSWLNLVLSAYHEKAQDGQVLLIGQNEPPTNGQPARAEGNMGKIAVVRFRGKPQPSGRTVRADSRRATHIPVLKDHRTVVYSLRLVNLEKDEQLVMRARMCTENPHEYAARVSAEVILADSRDATESSGRAREVAPFNGEIGKFNGSNCLPDKTYTTRKHGSTRILESAGQRLFVNLVATSSNPERSQRPEKRGDAVHVKPGGFLEIQRFPPDVAA